MRVLPVIFVTVVVVGGCAQGLSRIGVNSTKPASTVANCIGERWSRQYPNVSIVGRARSLNVSANVGIETPMLMHAEVLPTAFGSWVSLSTPHHEIILRGHPVISVALACAQ